MPEYPAPEKLMIVSADVDHLLDDDLAGVA
jgi:hypothetical protein